jgi:hypothetical protein
MHAGSRALRDLIRDILRWRKQRAVRKRKAKKEDVLKKRLDNMTNALGILKYTATLADEVRVLGIVDSVVALGSVDGLALIVNSFREGRAVPKRQRADAVVAVGAGATH